MLSGLDSAFWEMSRMNINTTDTLPGNIFIVFTGENITQFSEGIKIFNGTNIYRAKQYAIEYD